MKHKDALYEIFEEAKKPGGILDHYCDAVLKTSISKIPGAAENIVLLGDFISVDARVGFLKEKYRTLSQEVMCVSVVKDDDYETAEQASFDLGKRVRTVLRDNRTLISTSYPTGAAIEPCAISESSHNFFLYEEMLTAATTMTLVIKVKEED